MLELRQIDPPLLERYGQLDSSFQVVSVLAVTEATAGCGLLLHEAALPMRAATAWATANDATRMAVETQNVNVAACRFYRKNGFELVSIERFAYPDLPEESRLIWCRDLS
jgi:GNAT superfamily N-acetyltransferase